MSNLELVHGGHYGCITKISEMAMNKAFPRFNLANLRDGFESVRLKIVTNSITCSFALEK